MPDSFGHGLNNLLCKIVGSAELALDRVQDPVARAELEAIIGLAEEGATLVRNRGGQQDSEADSGS